MNFTPYDLDLLKCALISAIYGCENRIAELKAGKLETPNNREQLTLNETSKLDYIKLLEKVRNLEKETRANANIAKLARVLAYRGCLRRW